MHEQDTKVANVLVHRDRKDEPHTLWGATSTFPKAKLLVVDVEPWKLVRNIRSNQSTIRKPMGISRAP